MLQYDWFRIASPYRELDDGGQGLAAKSRAAAQSSREYEREPLSAIMIGSQVSKSSGFDAPECPISSYSPRSRPPAHHKFKTSQSMKPKQGGIAALLQGRVARQRHCRAPLALSKIRRGLPARLWRGSEARASIGRYLGFYDGKRPHSSLAAETPDQAYFDNLLVKLAA